MQSKRDELVPVEEVVSGLDGCQGRSKFGPLRRSKSRPVGEGVAVFVGRLERSLRSAVPEYRTRPGAAASRVDLRRVRGAPRR